MPFHAISPCDLTDNFFTAIGDEWMLVCAGTMEQNNAMTASWGQAGILWSKPVATCYVRPQRHTRQFIDSSERFTLSFFEAGTHRRELELMGSQSGRDVDKPALTGLAVAPFGQHRAPGFEAARLVLVCRTLYRQDLEMACFVDAATAQSNYPDGDFHRMYVGEIEGVYTRP